MEINSLLIYKFLQVCLIIVLAVVGAIIIQQKFRNYLRHKERHVQQLHFDPKLAQKYRRETFQRSETRRRIIVRVLQTVIFFLAFAVIIYLIPPLRSLSYSLLAGAGIVAVIVGFAVQKSFANMFAGIFIAIYEPFHIGDFVKFGEKTGVIEDITLHHTVIREWRNRRFIVPNALISEELIENFTINSPAIFKTFEISVGYDAHIDKAKKIVLNHVLKHKLLVVPQEMVNGEPIKQEPWVKVVDWLDSGIQLRIGFWVQHPIDGYTMKHDLLETIKKDFDKQGIPIPYPHRTIVYKKQEN